MVDIRQALGSSYRVNVTLQAMQEIARDQAKELRAEQLASQLAITDRLQEIYNPFAAKYKKRQKSIKEQSSRVQKMFEAKEKAEKLKPIERLKDTAEQYQQRNPELKAKLLLLLLRDYIKPDDTKEEILRKIQEFFPDVSLADEVLDFLLETTEGELARRIAEAKADFNKEFGREIIAGRNIGMIAREAAEKGLGAPTSLRDLYRDITGNPRPSTTLFEELSQKYAYKDLRTVISFLLHSLGADMKSKGPSIARGLLYRLISETRSLQAILGVYNFFKGRMRLVHSLFDKSSLEWPQQLSFELMAKQFITLLQDRYPSVEKIFQLATKLGIEKWIMAKIIVFSQLRDAVREVALHQIYKSLQHRDDLYNVLIEALEDLEDELDELEEEEEEEEEEKEEGEEGKAA